MKRLGIIIFFSLLFIAFIVIWNKSYWSGLEESYVPVVNKSHHSYLPIDRGVFSGSEKGLKYAIMPYDSAHMRSLDTYYDNRAYDGAPPSIPHPVAEERSAGGVTCLQCHKSGGFVTKYDAYAPITPHPEMVNCRQCHVVKNTESLFVATEFTEKEHASVGDNNALLGSPPVIPHHIQMRENCLACHAGPAAPKEIRVTHPERVNCMQCHVLKLQEGTDMEMFNAKINLP
ncbi:cytochrome C [Joostella atrarenae]|uniref:Cytochrome C n=1 Tax=Joostella atrarenae TaxID=679257 RepID=A0ABS9J3K9_9FLAO|nr:nitrate reductase cytochrome c-type subunit [Joostella atrarenae]MCF8714928.1 cytochrome C [Joostella atrarenae]